MQLKCQVKYQHSALTSLRYAENQLAAHYIIAYQFCLIFNYIYEEKTLNRTHTQNQDKTNDIREIIGFYNVTTNDLK